MKSTFIIFLAFIGTSLGYSQNLKIVEQDYIEALEMAKEENKLLLIDFYTTWCAPCKKLDKLVFQNKNVQQKLGNNFILLRYDAEIDSIFHLSKKHHVSSYPTGLILNNNGYVVNRKYGFPGEGFQELRTSVFLFTNEAIELNMKNQFLKGYSNGIDISNYPQFYIDYVNRDQIKIDEEKKFKEYLATNPDLLSEEFFSTMLYFAIAVPDIVVDKFLENREKYLDLYGTTDVKIAMYFFSYGKLKTALTEKNEAKFLKAKQFAIQAMGNEASKSIRARFETSWKELKNN